MNSTLFNLKSSGEATKLTPLIKLNIYFIPYTDENGSFHKTTCKTHDHMAVEKQMTKVMNNGNLQ